MMYYSTDPQWVSWKCQQGMSMAGLDHQNDGWNYHDLDFSVYCDNYSTAVHEANRATDESSRISPAATSSDIFKIQVTGYTVEYFKNNVKFFTSTKKPVFPLHMDASFTSVGNAINGATMFVFPNPN